MFKDACPLAAVMMFTVQVSIIAPPPCMRFHLLMSEAHLYIDRNPVMISRVAL